MDLQDLLSYLELKEISGMWCLRESERGPNWKKKSLDTTKKQRDMESTLNKMKMEVVRIRKRRERKKKKRRETKKRRKRTNTKRRRESIKEEMRKKVAEILVHVHVLFPVPNHQEEGETGQSLILRSRVGSDTTQYPRHLLASLLTIVPKDPGHPALALVLILPHLLGLVPINQLPLLILTNLPLLILIEIVRDLALVHALIRDPDHHNIESLATTSESVHRFICVCNKVECKLKSS
jgi:hypothetical protein